MEVTVTSQRLNATPLNVISQAWFSDSGRAGWTTASSSLHAVDEEVEARLARPVSFDSTMVITRTHFL